MAPRTNLPRIVRSPGPKSIPQLRKRGYKKAGPKHGKNVWALPKAAGPTKPQSTPSPYEQRYGETAPWAIPLLEGLDKDQSRRQEYVSGKVMPWLSQGLAALTGVDPKAPGYNTVAQQQYLANIQGPVGNALNAASAAQPAAVAPTTPGGVAAAPNAYLGTAMGQYSAQRGGAAIMEAQAQQTLNTVQQATFAQGALRTIADVAAGLPAIYVQKRNELRSRIDQWVAEQEVAKAGHALDMAKFEETMRRNRVDESIRAMNAETQAALGFGQLGLRADEQAFDQTPSMGPVPEGFVQLPDGKVVRDPTYGGGAGAGGGAIDKTLTANRLKKQGFVGGWKAKPKNVKGPFVQASDTGQFFKKPAKAAAGGTVKRKPISDLSDELVKKYHGPDGPGTGGGWEAAAKGDRKRAAQMIVRWVLDNKASFMGSNRSVNRAALEQVIKRIGGPADPQTGRPLVESIVLDILARGYITGDRWR